jgi:hypothetical protein
MDENWSGSHDHQRWAVKQPLRLYVTFHTFIGLELIYESDYTGDRIERTHSRTSTFLHRLPREIRGRIYALCVQGLYNNEVFVRRATDTRKPCTFLIRESFGQQSYQWIEDPMVQVISEKTLGVEIAKELLESYYETRTFKFSHREVPLLARFLKLDMFGLSMLPAFYARRIHIQLQHNIGSLPESAEENQLEEERRIQALEAFGAALTVRTEVAIDVDLYDGSRGEAFSWIMPETVNVDLVQVVEIVRRLRQRGLRIKMSRTGAWDK